MEKPISSIYCLTKQFEFRIVEVEITSHRYAEMERKKVTSSIKQLFRASLVEVFGNKMASMFQIHHIIPLHLGGKSVKENLFPLMSWEHKNIHDFIDAQIEGMKIGEKREIIIPVPRWDAWLVRFDQPQHSAIVPIL